MVDKREQRFNYLSRKHADTPATNVKEKVTIDYDEDTKSFNIYLTDIITGPEDYTNVFNTLLIAKEDETIRFILSTPGGRLDTVNKIRGLAQITLGRTVAVVGDVASAGTILALSFDEMIVMPNIEFMIHNYSGGVGGKGHELYSHAKFLQKEMPKVFRDFYKDFLTEPEISEVLSGQDIYLNAEEVEERWENVLNVRYAAAQAIEAEQLAQETENLIKTLQDRGYNVSEVKVPKTKGTK